jgi:hypothetical protein
LIALVLSAKRKRKRFDDVVRDRAPTAIYIQGRTENLSARLDWRQLQFVEGKVCTSGRPGGTDLRLRKKVQHLC